MSSPSRFTVADIQVMIEMRLDGASIEEISERFDAGYTTVYRILAGQTEFAKNMFDPSLIRQLHAVTKQRRRALTNEQARQALQMRHNKCTLKEIARHFGVSIGCIKGLVHGYTYREIE